MGGASQKAGLQTPVNAEGRDSGGRKPDVGNLLVRFEEGDGRSVGLRSSLLYWLKFQSSDDGWKKFGWAPWCSLRTNPLVSRLTNPCVTQLFRTHPDQLSELGVAPDGPMQRVEMLFITSETTRISALGLKSYDKTMTLRVYS